MDEHLLGIRIEDKKAQYGKILEDVRVANDELTAVLGKLDASNAVLESNRKEFLEIREAIETAKRELFATREAKASIEKRDVASQEKLAEAEQTLVAAHMAAKKIIDDADARLKKIEESIADRESSLESVLDSTANAITRLNTVSSQTYTAEQKLVAICDAHKAELNKLEEQKTILTKDIEAIEKDKESAALRLAEILDKHSAVIENIDRREKDIKRKETDAEVLRQRHLRLLREKQND